MLLVLIFLGGALYLAFYFSFSSFTNADSAHSGVAISVYQKVQDALFKLPASLPLAIMKIMLGLLIVYTIFDWTTSTIRRTRLRRSQEQRKEDLRRTIHGG